MLKQSDTEAYLWGRKAANKGLAKAEYAVGCISSFSHQFVADDVRLHRDRDRHQARHGGSETVVYAIGGSVDLLGYVLIAW